MKDTMAEDLDIEAMLEAPYMKEASPQKNGSKDDRRRRSSSDDDDDYSRRRRRRRSRSRSGSRSRHRRSRRSRSRSRESRSRREKRRSRSSSRDRDRDRRRRRSRSHEKRYRTPTPSPPPNLSPERKETPKEEEEIPPEVRDRRTVFCMQLARNIRPRDLEEFFCKVGQVRDVRIISDRNSRRSKGIAYIEFTDESCVPLALHLSGQRLLGAPIIIQPTQAEKNRAAAEAEKLKKPLGPTRLYVGSLHFNITEPMVKAIFEPFGAVDSVQLIYDSETGRSKGYGFIQFREADSAKRAMDQLNGFELAGRAIKVGPVTERGDSAAYSFLDDEEYEKGGVELNSTARAALMAKLSQGHDAGLSIPGLATPATAAAPAPLMGSVGTGINPAVVPPIQVPLPTPCFMLANMFDPTKEKEEGWDLDIRDDVLEECSKCGQVVHIYVDKNNSQGVVYVKASTPEVAKKCSASLNGRWFAGKQIIATSIPVTQYHAMFPMAASALRPLTPSTS